VTRLDVHAFNPPPVRVKQSYLRPADAPCLPHPSSPCSREKENFNNTPRFPSLAYSLYRASRRQREPASAESPLPLLSSPHPPLPAPRSPPRPRLVILARLTNRAEWTSERASERGDAGFRALPTFDSRRQRFVQRSEIRRRVRVSRFLSSLAAADKTASATRWTRNSHWRSRRAERPDSIIFPQ